MSIDQASSYDEIPYSDHCFPHSHADYLAALGRVYGLETPPVERCRVLELGCAGGGNLMPMALEFPDAQFVGIDLSRRQIEAGRAVVASLGLGNVDLRTLSITDVDDTLGRFDYIICHGVFSWVPEPVRHKILSICAENLSPNGIAYVSYNTYPGWHGRGMVREMLAYHVNRPTSPSTPADALDRVQRARSFLEETVRVLPNKASAYARILRTEEEFIRGVANSYFFHEHLEETNHPLYFHDFIKLASAKGLGFLAEARAPGLVELLPADALELLDRWAEDEVAREQYADFLCNRTFRRTLLYHERHATKRAPSPDALSALWLSTTLQPVSDEPDVASDAPEEFRSPDGSSTLTTGNPLLKAALIAMRDTRPHSLSFDDLWARAQSLLEGQRADEARRDISPHELREALLRGFLSNLIDLKIAPYRLTTEASERPFASPLARFQAEEGERVTNLRRRTVELDEFDRLVLRKLDGTNDHAAILRTLMDLAGSEGFTIYEGDEPIRDLARIEAMLGAEIGPCLSRLANLALLVH